MTRPATIAQFTGLKSAMSAIHDGIWAGAMKADERNVSGSSRKVLMPMIDSRCRTSMPIALDSAPKTVPSRIAQTNSTSRPPAPPE